MEQCVGSSVADAPSERSVRPTSTAHVRPSARVRYDLPRNTPTFLGVYDELHHAQVLLLLNKKDGSQFGLVQRSDGAKHVRSSVRELSDQASCFPKYKVALSPHVLVQYFLLRTKRGLFPAQMIMKETRSCGLLTITTGTRPSVSSNTTHLPTRTTST